MNCEEIVEPFLKCFSLIQMSNAAERSKAVGISLFRKLIATFVDMIDIYDK